MYDSSAKVVSHLPYGAEWDSVLQWLKETTFEGDDTPIGSDSKEWGNYYNATFTYGAGLTKDLNTDTLINTGDTEYTNKNNIYDIAGNLWEWTQEKYSTGAGRAFRGGYFSGGINNPAATRDDLPETHNIGNSGFRAALYIK